MSQLLWTSEEIALATGGTASDPFWVSGTISIDTRTLMPGDLFVALQDQRDGHDFVEAAFKAGAAGALVSKPVTGGPIIRVDDVQAALEMMGIAARARSGAIRTAVTGSVGKTPAGAGVFVDYAHTPDGLDVLLRAVRPHTAGRLKVIFGCGGDRDAKKRPIMGEIATRQADDVIVTDDNPRTEDAAAIRKAVIAGAPGAREIGDREAAIRTVIAELKKGDTLVIAGKGHETGQIVGKTVIPFSDQDTALSALAGEHA